MTTEQTLRLLECFVAGMPARQAAEVAQVNRNSARLCYHHLRETIAVHLGTGDTCQGTDDIGHLSEDASFAHAASSNLSLLQSHYQGDYQVVPIAGLVEHFGHVQVLPLPESVESTMPDQCTRAPEYDAVICVDEAVESTTLKASRQGRMHIIMRDGITRETARFRVIRSFWRRSANLLRRYNGVPRQSVFLYLKECEWRFSDGSHEASLATLQAWFIRRQH
jgi:transposase